MRNRGIVRGRMFVGGFILFAAVIVWGTAILTSPHGTSDIDGAEYLRSAAVIYLRNAAFGAIGLCALAAVLLFPARRPNSPKRDIAVGLLILMVVATSLYQLWWLRMTVAG